MFYEVSPAFFPRVSYVLMSSLDSKDGLSSAGDVPDLCQARTRTFYCHFR